MKQTAIINDDDGKLAEIARQANDPGLAVSDEAPPIIIEGANQPGSMREAVQQSLNEAGTEPLVEESPTSEQLTDEQKRQKLADETPTHETEEERLAREQSQPETEEAKAERLKQEQTQAELDKRLDQHPRFQELNSKVKELTPLAENARLDAAFCDQYRIPPEQKKTAMELCALLNTAPEKALEQLEKLVENIKLSTGKLLPPDLSKEVADGVITKERATELHMARLQLQSRDQQSRQLQQSSVQQFEQARASVQNQWDATKRKTDPDFAPKKSPEAEDGKWELTATKLKELTIENPPKSLDEAVALCDKAYSYAHKIFSRFQTVPRARRTMPPESRSSEETNGGPKPGETMQRYIARTVGSQHHLTIGKR